MEDFDHMLDGFRTWFQLVVDVTNAPQPHNANYDSAVFRWPNDAIVVRP